MSCRRRVLAYPRMINPLANIWSHWNHCMHLRLVLIIVFVLLTNIGPPVGAGNSGRAYPIEVFCNAFVALGARVPDLDAYFLRH